MTARRPRGPAGVFTALTLVLVLLILALSLSREAAASTHDREFAPQAVENISDAPSDQSSSAGQGEGECLDGQECGLGDGPGGGESTETPAPIEVSRVRRCIGDPPRQIEDPQSPPCVPYWAGDNGGATSKGVTRSEVRIAIQGWDENLFPLLERFFNRRFEFFGRTVRFLHVPECDGGGGGNPTFQKAKATCVDEQYHAFASSDYSGLQMGGPFYEELARRHIVAATTQPELTERQLQRVHPYLWSYPTDNDTSVATLGAWACAQLAGKPASHTAPGIAERKFGLIMNSSWGDDTIDAAPLEEALSRCGVTLAHKVEYAERPDVANTGSSNSQQESQNAILQMKTAEVTSIFCLCVVTNAGNIFRAAKAQAYLPEWLIGSYYLMDWAGVVRAFAHEPEQLAHAFGLSFHPKLVGAQDMPQTWAMKEVNPGAGASSTSSLLAYEQMLKYKTLLLLSSGIQMAGPRLTPETFGSALHRTRFPNPPDPLMQGKVGFLNGDHSMIDDAAQIWWSEAARGPFEDDKGSYCYVDHGTRQATGSWKVAPDRYFTGECDAGK